MIDEPEDCELCGEPEEETDPLGHFLTGDGDYVLAHGQCGEDAGLDLA